MSKIRIFIQAYDHLKKGELCVELADVEMKTAG